MTVVRKARRAVILLEVACTLVLLGLTMALTARLVIQYRDAQAYFLAKRAAQLAAEGLLERFRAGELPAAGPVELDLGQARGTATVVATPGRGQWAGLQHVTVTVVVMAKRQRPVTALATAYMGSQGIGHTGIPGSAPVSDPARSEP